MLMWRKRVVGLPCSKASPQTPIWTQFIIATLILAIKPLQAARSLQANVLTTSTCDTEASMYPKSCSPNWCTFNNNTGCLFPSVNVDYAAQIASLSCKVCTQRLDGVCSRLPSTFISSHVKAAYCNDAYLVVHSDGLPNHSEGIATIPNPPGAGGEGLNTQGAYLQCVTRSMTPQFLSYKVPLSVTLLSNNGSNAASFPTGASLNVAVLPQAGAMGVALNGLPIFPANDNHDAYFWEACEADICNAHVGKGGDYHYHGDPYGPDCLYGPANYTGASHPPVWGYSLDGVPIHGRYTSLTQDGWAVEFDKCGGHTHGDLGYHYHSYVMRRTSTLASPTSNNGKAYVAYMPGPMSCWRGDISKIPNFWQDGQAAYDNSKNRPAYSFSGRSDVEQLRPCCAHTHTHTHTHAHKRHRKVADYPAQLLPHQLFAQAAYDNSKNRPAYSFSGRSDVEQLRPCCGSTQYLTAPGITLSLTSSGSSSSQPPSPPSGGSQQRPPAPGGGGPGGPGGPPNGVAINACFFVPNATANMTTGFPGTEVCSNGGAEKPSALPLPANTTWQHLVWNTSAAVTLPSDGTWTAWLAANTLTTYTYIAYTANLSASGLAALGLRLPTATPLYYNGGESSLRAKCEGQYDVFQEVLYPSGLVWKVCAVPRTTAPSSSTGTPQTVSTGAQGQERLQIPSSASLTVSKVACNSIATNKASFIASFQAVTASGFSTSTGVSVSATDIEVSSVVTACAATRRGLLSGSLLGPSTGPKQGRELLQSGSSVSVAFNIALPAGVSTDQAKTAGSTLAARSGTLYTSGQFASDFGVTAASLTVQDPVTAGSYSSTDGGDKKKKLALGLGLGLGLGIPVLVALLVAVVLASKRRGAPAVAPAPAAERITVQQK
eukprot:CAMPEP_0202920872 /NCGR_PEP_ID=MMETSP1392-20130828/77083_1 /ASSEMBLY_ACC=CAM_ASM_000868 /TAXON_ID=225041 /ORGANISM="Chlamydomonas chlamydogama, Strain SAG 11-48b" /LENGTH=884 /DNA_ID=CAMNT_0049614391 /DNA_START=111 /DNA_END=2766 /DNA_ORIENTATION=+